MITNILTAIVAPVTSLIDGIGKRKVKKLEIESAKHIKTLEGIQESNASAFIADIKRTEDLSTSWKDEYITIVMSAPAILCFFPLGAEIVSEGFLALSLAPTWYQNLLVMVFTVGAGVPLAGKAVKTLKSINKD